MNRNTLKVSLIKGLDWLIFILLGLVSIFFMVDCFKKFANESTYFEVSSKEKQHVESPTLTFCFGPGYKQDVMDKYNLSILKLMYSNDTTENLEELYDALSYHIGEDFNITMMEQKMGLVHINSLEDVHIDFHNSSLDIKIDPILTGMGLCYKLALSTNKVGYFYIMFEMNFSENIQSLPDILEMTITSETNSYGIIWGVWSEGKELRIETPFGAKTTPVIQLNMKKIEFLEQTSNCNEQKSYYECYASELFQQNHTTSCPNLCVPYFLKDFTNLIQGNASLNICKKSEDQSCMLYGPFNFVTRNSYGKCPVSCNQAIYDGSVRNIYYPQQIRANQAHWTLVFSSLNILEEKETLAFGVVEMVGYVGGTLGLFIGFSFYGIFSYPLEKLILRLNTISN